MKPRDSLANPALRSLFFSYSRFDLPIVQEIYLWLNQDPALSIWFDQAGIRPARRWQAEIKNGLDQCDAVILFASKFSLASANVKDEWLYALETLRKPIYIWLLDDCKLDPQLKDCPIVDLRVDPFDTHTWRRGLHTRTDIPSSSPIAVNRSVLPAYVQFYIHRSISLLVIGEILGFLGLFAYITDPMFPRPDVIWLQAALLIMFPSMLLWHTARMRQRLTPWSDLWFQISLFMAFWLALGYPLLWFVNTIFTYHPVVGLTLTCLVGPLFLFLFAARINTLAVNSLLGTETFNYRNTMIEEFVESRSGADRAFQHSLRALKLYGWCPAFRYSRKLGLAAREKSIFATLDSGHEVRSTGQRGVLILHHRADTFFARITAASLSDMKDQIRVECLSPNWNANLHPGQHPMHIIFILSGYSAQYAEQLIQLSALRSQSDLLIVSLEKTHKVLPDLWQLQWIDATTWNFSQALSAVRRTIREESITFTGAKDARSNALGAPSRYLFWLITLLALPLIGANESLQLNGLTHLSTWPFYLVAAAVLWQAMDRRYSLRLSGWILLLVISLLWVELSVNGLWQERGNMVLLTIGLSYVSWLFLRSDQFRTQQIMHVSKQQGATANEYSFLSILYWGPDKAFEWRILIPAFLAWVLLLGVTIHIGS